MAGPVVLVSYEDAPARIAHRLRWINENAVPPGPHLWPDPEPLWVAASDRGGESHAGNQWDALWREIRAIGARLVEVDPVSAALTDVSTTETGPVHAFLQALTREAAPDEAAGWQGCGVLLVAHDTKAARNALARGEDPGAGMVAGSAAWYDGARGVLSLMRDPLGSDNRLLECVKANYGRTGWGARLGVCRIQAASNPYAGKSQPIVETRTRYSRKFRVNRAKGDVCCPHLTAKRDQSDRLLAERTALHLLCFAHHSLRHGHGSAPPPERPMERLLRAAAAPLDSARRRLAGGPAGHPSHLRAPSVHLRRRIIRLWPWSTVYEPPASGDRHHRQPSATIGNDPLCAPLAHHL